MKKTICIPIIVSLFFPFLSSCATQHGYEGATTAGTIGAIAGALIDRNNHWRGAVIGGSLGGALGEITTEISARAARESAFSRRPVAYRSTDGWQRVETSPVSYNAQTKCHKVHEKIWQGDKLVEDKIREVCESEKTYPGY